MKIISMTDLTREQIEAPMPNAKDGIARLIQVLKWYGEQSRLARLIHSEGDKGRHALANDGGNNAKDAVEAYMALLQAPQFQPAPTHRHKKRGTTYTVIGTAELQAAGAVIENEDLVIYRCMETGKLWARPKTEFEDGRFEILPAQQVVDLDG